MKPNKQTTLTNKTNPQTRPWQRGRERERSNIHFKLWQHGIHNYKHPHVHVYIYIKRTHIHTYMHVRMYTYLPTKCMRIIYKMHTYIYIKIARFHLSNIISVTFKVNLEFFKVFHTNKSLYKSHSCSNLAFCSMFPLEAYLSTQYLFFEKAINPFTSGITPCLWQMYI